MRLLTLIALSCLSLFAVAAEEAAPLPPLEEQVAIEFSVSWPETNKPLLDGRTNLPDGTLLAVYLEPAAADADPAEVTVAGGAFSIQLGADAGLAVGEYTVAVSMMLPMSQPPEVVAIIGENAEKVKGEVTTQPMPITIEAAR